MKHFAFGWSLQPKKCAPLVWSSKKIINFQLLSSPYQKDYPKILTYAFGKVEVRAKLPVVIWKIERLCLLVKVRKSCRKYKSNFFLPSILPKWAKKWLNKKDKKAHTYSRLRNKRRGTLINFWKILRTKKIKNDRNA